MQSPRGPPQKSSSLAPSLTFCFFLFPKPARPSGQSIHPPLLRLNHRTRETVDYQRSLICERTCEYCHQDMSRTKLAPEVNRSVQSHIAALGSAHKPDIHTRPSHTPAARCLAYHHATQLHFPGPSVDAICFTDCLLMPLNTFAPSLHCPFLSPDDPFIESRSPANTGRYVQSFIRQESKVRQ